MALTVGSGDTHVFSTPWLVALMEEAACHCIVTKLDAGNTSVGTEISVKHLQATPAGMTVKATATITGINGRSVVFAIVARDEKEIIGEV